ncbi:MAG: hypothetical protein A2048_07490 [Deltaproteobacteria bacterium GWA2_45_12]|nr:MAG: hypothetical protein A2048_07490 [Deltaproteobacteria bacterium GWA2_45_12]
MKKFLFILFLLAAVTFAGWKWTQYFFAYQNPQTIILEIPPGASLKTISRLLFENKVIPHKLSFELYARLIKKANKLKAGEYELEAGLRPLQVLDKMVAGQVRQYALTIPEGFNLDQIGDILITKGLATKQEWFLLKKETSLLRPLGVEATSLEGYLFPETYTYTKTSTAKNLMENMVRLFAKKLMDEEKNKAASMGLNLHQWVTLASLIEKETGLGSERPLIAGVFLNRLKLGMLLQTDPSVIYGIPHFNGNLTLADLERDTPYNTYTRPGLPPGPICSPGWESMQAVLHPAQTQALYFVGKGDGSHFFSENLDQHNQAVRYYQLRQGREPIPTFHPPLKKGD